MFNSIISTNLTIYAVLICSLVSIILGTSIALIYRKSSYGSRNYLFSLIILPLLVQMVIMMVNGNLGTSVAVLGTFGLIRFRSVPGTSKEIVFIFLAMAIGIATGMGHIWFAIFICFLALLVFIIFNLLVKYDPHNNLKELKITISENLDYNNIFDDIFQNYAKKVSLEKVKTVNMGCMYELNYLIELKDANKEKEMIDEIRCRNGNLTIVCGRISSKEEL